jgi:hypothetical protein
MDKDTQIRPVDLIDNFESFLSNFSSIISSIRIGLFDFMSDKDFISISEIKKGLNLGINERNLLDFLDIMYVNKHLLRNGVGLDAKYKLKHSFFVKSNPSNLCMMMHMLDRMRKLTDIVDEHLLTGKMSSGKQCLFDLLSSNPLYAESFLTAMGLIQDPNFSKIAECVDFSKFKTVVDVGGCLGNLLVKIKKKYDHLNCINFDLPFVEKHCLNFVKNNGLEGKISFQVGDFFNDELPKSDVVIMGNILHDWGHEKKKLLVKKVYDSLSENGIFIIVERAISEERNSSTDALCESYVMIMELVEGFNMTKTEIKDYVIDAGFKKVEYLDELFGADGAISYK